MNREIKFRAKRVDLNDWIHGYLREVFGETKRTFVIAPANKFESDGYTDMEEDYVQPDTIGQFTGLCDKNGKEIYEGDILKTFTGSKCEVVYHEASFKIRYNNRHESNILTRSSVFVLDYEVIGNIYDNSELLEE